MKNKVFFVFVIITLLASCSHNKPIYKLGVCKHSLYTSNIVTKTPIDSLSGDCMLGVYGIDCVFDSIAVFELKNSSSCFRAINLNNNNYVDFLTIGRGPEEVSMGMLSAARKEGDKLLFDVSAINEQELLTIDLLSTIDHGKTELCQVINVPALGGRAYATRGNILAESLFDEDIFSFKLYDISNNNIIKSSNIFGKEEYLSSYQPLFSPIIRMKPDGNKICLGMLLFDEVNIFDIYGEDHICMTINNKIEDMSILKEALAHGTLGHKYYYWDMDVTDNHIYALYYNCKKEDKPSIKSSSIHVFTWDGVLSQIINIDKPLAGIAVSQDETLLYGLSNDEIVYTYAL